MAAGTVTVFNQAKKYIGDGTVDLDTDTFKCAILSAGGTAPLATTTNPRLEGALFTEVTDGGGTYVTGGATLTCTYLQSVGTITFDSSTNPSWAADALNPTDARYGLVYKVGTANGIVNPALCFIDLGTTISMVTNTLTINWHADGIFTVS